jgi:hypothetical protein
MAVIGIDLGTSDSGAAVLRRSRRSPPRRFPSLSIARISRRAPEDRDGGLQRRAWRLATRRTRAASTVAAGDSERTVASTLATLAARAGWCSTCAIHREKSPLPEWWRTTARSQRSSSASRSPRLAATAPVAAPTAVWK